MSRPRRQRGGRLGRLAGDCRGQVTLFFILCLGVMVMLLAFLVNLGQVLHEKILVQTVADMAALSAANVQAAGLNEIADLNTEWHQLHLDCQRNVNGRTFRGRDGRAMFERYRYWMEDRTLSMMKSAAGRYAGHAWEAAARTVDWFSARYGRQFRWDTVGHTTYPYDVLTDVGGEGRWGAFWWDFAHCVPSKWHPCPNFRRPYYTFHWRQPRSGGIYNAASADWDSYAPRASKALETPTYFRVRVWQASKTPFLWLERFRVNVPQVEAYALAEPTGGDIGNLDPGYRARLMPLRTIYFMRDQWDAPLDRGRFRH